MHRAWPPIELFDQDAPEHAAYTLPVLLAWLQSGRSFHHTPSGTLIGGPGGVRWIAALLVQLHNAFQQLDDGRNVPHQILMHHKRELHTIHWNYLRSTIEWLQKELDLSIDTLRKSYDDRAKTWEAQIHGLYQAGEGAQRLQIHSGAMVQRAESFAIPADDAGLHACIQALQQRPEQPGPPILESPSDIIGGLHILVCAPTFLADSLGELTPDAWHNVGRDNPLRRSIPPSNLTDLSSHSRTPANGTPPGPNATSASVARDSNHPDTSRVASPHMVQFYLSLCGATHVAQQLRQHVASPLRNSSVSFQSTTGGVKTSKRGPGKPCAVHCTWKMMLIVVVSVPLRPPKQPRELSADDAFIAESSDSSRDASDGDGSGTWVFVGAVIC